MPKVCILCALNVGPKGSNLFVFHLPKSIADADLQTLFSPFGTIVSAKVGQARDRQRVGIC